LTESHDDLNDIAYGNGIFIATGKTGTILRSTNAITWSPIASGVTTNLNGISYGANTFVIVGANSSSLGATIIKSNDGLSWTNTSTSAGTSQGFFHVEYLNDLFLASGFYTRTRFSTNAGNSFTTNETGNTYRSRGSAYGNGIYFAAAQNQSDSNLPANLLSTSGTHWSHLSTPNQDDRNSAIFFQNTFITVGNAGSIWQSDPFMAPTDWSIWRAEQFPTYPANSGASEDFDGDGVPNLLEYISGTDPKSPSSYTTPTLAIESGYVTITLQKSPDVSGYTLLIETSDDLVLWTTTGLTILTENANSLKVRLNTPISGQPNKKAFLRAKATIE